MAWDDLQGTGSTILASDWNAMTAYTKSVIATASNVIAADGTFTGSIIVSGTVDGVDIAALNIAVGSNTAKETNVTTNLSLGTVTSTTMDVNSSDGTNATLIAANTDDAGLLTAAKFDEIEANNAKVTNANHTGEVTGSATLTIADNVVDEANLKLEAGPTNDYILTADSTKSGGMKWAAAAAGFADPMTTRGDIIYKNSSTTTTRLGAGTVGQVLTSDGTDIGWDDAGAGTVTSVGISGSDGIEVDSGTPITGSGTIALGLNKANTLSFLNVEDGADVTDTDNVTAAGALMDSEVDADIKTLVLPANTTISAYGKTLVDDADAGTARATLDVDQAGTDNSTDVTLNASATTGGMSISTQEISHRAATNAQTGYMTATLVGNIETNNAKVTNANHSGDVTGSTALTIGADKVLDSHINWGTAATQVSAADMPIADAGSKITATEVEGALQENRTAIDLNTTASHTQGTDTTLGSGAVAADHGTGSVDQIINVCYGTGSTAPTASTTTEGTLYIQYTS